MSKIDEGSKPSTSRGRRRIVLAIVAAFVVVLAVVTAHLFVWPDLPKLPAKADAIVQLGGPGDRRRVALDLARDGVAPLVAISVSDDEAGTSWCADGNLFNVSVLCFHSEPFTTRGEARSIAQMAQQRGWHSVIIVTSTDQATRAELRVSRCYTGRLYVATAHLPTHLWPKQIVYQWGATIKAYTWERTC
jgi:hypothetical protein